MMSISSLLKQIKNNKITTIDFTGFQCNYKSKKKIVRKLATSINEVHMCCASTEGWFALGGNSETQKKIVEIYNSATLQIIRTVSSFEAMIALPKNRIAIGMVDEIKIFDILTGLIKTFTYPICTFGNHKAMAYLPGEKLAAIVEPGTIIKIFDLEQNKKLTIKIFNLGRDKELKSVYDVFFEYYCDLIYLPKSKLIAASSSDVIELWDIEKAKRVKILKGHVNNILSLAVSKNGILASLDGYKGGNLKIWNIEKGKCVATFKGCGDDPQTVLALPNEQFITSTFYNIDVKTKEVIKLGYDSPVSAFDLLPNGNIIADSQIVCFPSTLQANQLKKIITALKLNTSVIEIKWGPGYVDAKLKAQLEYYIKRNQKIHIINQKAPGCGLLHYAIFSRDTSFQEELLDNPDINADAATARGTTPLKLAVKMQDKNAVSRLLDANVDINYGEKLNISTALHEAAICGNFTIIRLLLSRGANILARMFDAEKNQYLTPAEVAFNHGHLKISQYLKKIEKTAHSKHVPHGVNNFPPIQPTAPEINYPEIPKTQSIIKNDDTTKKKQQNKKEALSVLWLKVNKDGDIKAVKQILRQEIDINYQDQFGNTMLHYATKNKHIPLCVWLLIKKANKLLKNKENKKPFDYFNEQEQGQVTYLRRRQEYINGIALDVAQKITNRMYPYTGDQFVFNDGTTSVMHSTVSTNPKRRKIQEIFQNYLRKLLNSRDLRSILEIVCLAVQGKHDGPKGVIRDDPRLSIVVDPDSDTTEYLDNDNDPSHGYYVSNIIKLGAKVTKENSHDEICGVLIHEITHFVAAEVFKHGCRPYAKNDKDSEALFYRVSNHLLKLIQSNQKVDPILCKVFNQYDQNEWHNELIARTAQLIGQKGKEGKKILQTQAPELYDYFVNKFVPKCKTHFQYLLNKATNQYMKNFPGHDYYMKKKNQEKNPKKQSDSNDPFQYLLDKAIDQYQYIINSHDCYMKKQNTFFHQISGDFSSTEKNGFNPEKDDTNKFDYS